MGIFNKMAEELRKNYLEGIQDCDQVFRMNPISYDQLRLDAAFENVLAFDCAGYGLNFFGVSIEVSSQIDGWCLEVLR